MVPKNYELIRDKINASTTQAELTSAISFAMNNGQGLTDGQQKALRTLVDEKDNVLRVSEEYTPIDNKNFKPIEVEVSNPEKDISAFAGGESTPSPQVVDTIPDTPKRTRKPKESDQSTVIPQTIQTSYKVSRRVNKPIDGVQYSNNEYIVEVTATDKDVLLAELDAVEAEVIQRLSLYNKDALEAYGKKKFDEGHKSGMSEAPKVVATPVPKANTFEYDMSQASTLDLQYTLARYQRLNQFVLQSFEKFPEVKAFYELFDRANPKVPQPNL